MSRPVPSDGRPAIRLGRDGQLLFRRRGHGLKLVAQDIYPHLLRLGWPATLLLLFGGWVAANGVFAVAYLALGDCISAQDPRSFLQAFSFSVQTMSSIGYGAMHPTCDPTRWLANLEAFVGMLMMAVGTGLMFAKFSRPVARIAFSDKAVIWRFDGKPMLAVRLANKRGNRIVDAEVRVVMLREEETEEGYRMRRLHDLALVRERSPTFALSWTILHPIEPGSAFSGLSVDTLPVGLVGLILTVTGLDETYGQVVHAQHILRPEDIVWNHRFSDMLHIGDRGHMELRLDQISDLNMVPLDHRLRSTRLPAGELP